MPLLTWNQSLSVGIEELDAQHQKLIDILNHLYDAMGDGHGTQALKPVLHGLVEYTATHFDTEERYMQEFNYPDYAHHKDEHDVLTWKVAELSLRLEQGGKTMLTIETLTFIKAWLTAHILGTDMHYTEFFKQHGLK